MLFSECGPGEALPNGAGRIGCQLDVAITAVDRMRLDQAYEAIMDAVGERRGRPRGIKKVQTKLMLPESAYLALKRAAAASHETMSGLVAQLAEGLEQTGTR